MALEAVSRAVNGCAAHPSGQNPILRVKRCSLFTLFTRKLIHTPTLIIDSEGIRSHHPFNRWEVKWEEIDAIYSHSHGTAFAIDLLPTGLRAYFSRQGGRIPRWLDPTVPQQVLANQGTNLALPIDQLLSQIREKFVVQLEHYQGVEYERNEKRFLRKVGGKLINKTS